MKTFAALTVSALIVVSAMNSATALPAYCEEFPNGAAICRKETGHAGGKTATNTPLGTAFAGAGAKWSKEFCMSKYPGYPTMTVGDAFGDPCCTWTKGGKPDFLLTDVIDGATQPKPTECPAGAGVDSTGGASATDDPSAGGTNGNDGGLEAEGSSKENDVALEAVEFSNEKGVPTGATFETSSLYGDSAEEIASDFAQLPGSTGGDAYTTPPTTPSVSGTPGCAAKGARKLRS